jgi:murein DD-endopeptidase MepM/ murein hydrolase activator NlpD
MPQQRNTMASYKIKKGDTLSAIAKANGTTVDAIAKANNIKNKNLIVTGKTLSIPGKSNTSASLPSNRQTGGTGSASNKSGPSAVTGRSVRTTSSSSAAKSTSGYSQQSPRTGSWKDSKVGKSVSSVASGPKVGAKATTITRGEGKGGNNYSQQAPRTGSWKSTKVGKSLTLKSGKKGSPVKRGEGGSVKGSWSK